MSYEEVYPYTLDIQPCDRPTGQYRWIIRERGKLLQRSDRVHLSEAAALKSGQAELERVAAGRSR